MFARRRAVDQSCNLAAIQRRRLAEIRSGQTR